MKTEHKPLAAIRGEWFDMYRHSDGRVTLGDHGQFAWGRNQIQDSFSALLASLCARVAGISGITHLAIGSGEVAWDTAPPVKDPAQTELTTEYFRKAIPVESIYFIDPDTGIPTGGVPTSKIEISLTILSSEANGAMREFGLFGGDATITLDSGSMVNWVTHSRIDKDETLEIQRRVRIEFLKEELP